MFRGGNLNLFRTNDNATTRWKNCSASCPLMDLWGGTGLLIFVVSRLFSYICNFKYLHLCHNIRKLEYQKTSGVSLAIKILLLSAKLFLSD